MYASSSVSPVALQTFANSECERIFGKSELREYVSIEQTKQRKDKQMEKVSGIHEWEIVTEQNQRNRDYQRCVQSRIESMDRETKNRESLDPGKADVAHKCQEIEGGLVAVNAFTRDMRNTHIFVNMNNVTAVSQINKKTSIDFVIKSDNGDMGVLHAEI